MNILVTGGQGYLGSLLVGKLAASSRVSVVDINWFNAPEAKIPSTTYVNKDILSIECLEGFDVVVNLAALSCDPQADFNPGLCSAINTGGAYHLAKIAKRDGVQRFIQASTTSGYGRRSDLVTEDDDPLARTESDLTTYGMSKILAEHAILSLDEDSFRTSCFRLGTLGGWSQYRMRLDLVVNSMALGACVKGEITVVDPDAIRPHLDVRDAASLFYYAATDDFAFSGVFNAVACNYDIMSLAQTIKRRVSTFRDVEIVNQGSYDARSYRVSSSKLDREWRPQFTLNDTVEDLVCQFSAEREPDWWKDRVYYNIRQFKKLASFAGYAIPNISTDSFYESISK